MVGLSWKVVKMNGQVRAVLGSVVQSEKRGKANAALCSAVQSCPYVHRSCATVGWEKNTGVYHLHFVCREATRWVWEEQFFFFFF